MLTKRYYSYNQYLRQTFKTRVHKLSLDSGFNCPNLDGKISTQGCTFCNNNAFSYYTQNPKKSLKKQIEESARFASQRYKAKKFIAYFQSFSNTYADIQTLRKKYNTIKGLKNIVGISVSTRPDCIDKKKLSLLNSFSKKYKVYIEYGLQSIHDKTLKKINRNHNFQTLKDALSLTKSYKNIHPAVHIILGLPGETKNEMLKTAKILATLPLWGIKMHCLQILKKTALFNQYQKGKIKTLSQNEYINILIEFLRFLPKELVILRLVSEAATQELVEPKWLSQKSKVLIEIDKRLEKRNIWQGDRTVCTQP